MPPPFSRILASVFAIAKNTFALAFFLAYAHKRVRLGKILKLSFAQISATHYYSFPINFSPHLSKNATILSIATGRGKIGSIESL